MAAVLHHIHISALRSVGGRRETAKPVHGGGSRVWWMYRHSRLCVALVLSSHSEHQALAGVLCDFAPADVGVRRRRLEVTQVGSLRKVRAEAPHGPSGFAPSLALMPFNTNVAQRRLLSRRARNNTVILACLHPRTRFWALGLNFPWALLQVFSHSTSRESTSKCRNI